MKRLLLLLAVVLTGCAAQTFDWPVDDATTVRSLDETYFDELAEVNADPLCVYGDPLRASSRSSGCERLKSQVHQDYWRARRTLADRKGWK